MSGIDEQKLKIENIGEFNNLCICGRCTGVTIHKHDNRYKRIAQINWETYRNGIYSHLIDRRTTKKSIRKHNCVCYNCGTIFEGRIKKQLIDYFIEHANFGGSWYY